MEELERQLREDLEELGLPLDFTLELKGYSKTYNGRYNPTKKKVTLYTLRKNGKQKKYSSIIRTAIHEVIHHYQWNYEKDFVRVKGVMHNTEFKRLLRVYIADLENLERSKYDSFDRKSMERYRESIV